MKTIASLLLTLAGRKKFFLLTLAVDGRCFSVKDENV